MRKLLSVLLWPLRVFGLGSDAYTIWSYREQIVTVGSAVGTAIIAFIVAVAQRYPPYTLPLFALLAFAVALALVGWLVKFKHYVQRRRAASDPAPESPTSQADAQSSATIHEYTQDPSFTQAAAEAPLDERRQLTRKWRTEIENGDFTRTPHGHSQFCTTETYVEMEPFLQRHVKDRMRSHTGAAVAWVGSPHLRGPDGDRRAMIGELARIEKEWGVH